MVDLTVHLPALSSPRTVGRLDPEPSARRSIRPLIARRRARLAIEELRADADVLDVAMLARAGDRRARQVFDDAFAVLGSALAPWLARFEASVLVVGGSMAGSWDLVRPPLLGALRQAEPALAGLAVRRAAHPEDSALIGAAVHAWAVDQATAAGSWAKLDVRVTPTRASLRRQIVSEHGLSCGQGRLVVSTRVVLLPPRPIVSHRRGRICCAGATVCAGATDR